MIDPSLPSWPKPRTERPRPLSPLVRHVSWAFMAMLSSAVALVSYRYLAKAGPVPVTIAANAYVNPWLVIHATGAATALFVGPWQFLPVLRRRQTAAHRMCGQIYAAGCVTGGTAALVLATGVSAGPIAGTGFSLLGIAWIAATIFAVREILAQRVSSHRRWMIRSFALTLSAVTLRLYLPASFQLGLDPVLSYRVISWACWLPNMVLAELYLTFSNADAIP